MTLLQRIEYWGETHHPKWMDIVRIALGVFLVAKGVEFLNNFTNLLNLMPQWMPFSSFMMILVGHYIVGVHILGGVLIALGMITRAACLFQIPVLLGAVFFANHSGGALSPFSNLMIAVVTLLLLVYFLAAGSGSWSFDGVYANEKK